MEQPEKPRRGNRDRISSLPDHILHLIMSFLAAHAAVRLCVLSKRWKSLWKTMPVLNFDIFKFACDIEWGAGESNFNEPPYYEHTRNRYERFKDFVNMTLLRREASALDTFRLSSQMANFYYDMFIRSWLLYVPQHKPRDLDITINGKGSLPRNVFSCSSLVNLKLSVYRSQNNVEVINLPCLRKLHLAFIFVDQDFMEKLFCGCPMLEFLNLQWCNVEFSSIHSQSLKGLKIICTTGKAMELINTPNILSFHYTFVPYYECKMLLKMPAVKCKHSC